MRANFRASAFAFALSLSLSAAFAGEKNHPENIAISSAQELFLKKKRQLALRLLLKSPPQLSQSKMREGWQSVAQDMATRFFTDQGQKSYELGVSQLPRNLRTAEAHFKEAKEIEDGNLDVDLGLLRAQIMSEECQNAKITLLAVKPLILIAPQISDYEVQIAICLKDEALIEVFLKRKIVDAKIDSPLNRLATGWLKLQAKDLIRAQTAFKDLIGLEPTNPAALYWLFVTQRELEANAVAAAEAFSKNCRNFEEDIRRRKRPLIEYCLHLPEIEAYLKSNKSENSGE